MTMTGAIPQGRWAELIPEGDRVWVVVYQNYITASGMDRPQIIGHTNRAISETQALELIKPIIPVYKDGQIFREGQS